MPLCPVTCIKFDVSGEQLGSISRAFVLYPSRHSSGGGSASGSPAWSTSEVGWLGGDS